MFIMNAFAAYGWLGGLLLSFAHLRDDLGRMAHDVCADTLATVRDRGCFRLYWRACMQGLQIDTDHWRHFYLQLGSGVGAPTRPPRRCSQSKR